MGTTTRGYPYPEGSDPINQGDDVIKALATAVDHQLARTLTGLLSIAFANVQQQFGIITFPAGYFAQVPIVVTTADDRMMVATVSGPTTTSCAIIGQRLDRVNVSGSVGFHWVASSARPTPAALPAPPSAEDEDRVAAVYAEIDAAGGIDAWAAARAEADQALRA